MVVEKFQIYRAKITGKYICKSKNWICSVLLMPTNKTLPQVFIIILNSEGNCRFLLNSVFWRSIFSPAERGVGCVCVGRRGERRGRGEGERGGGRGRGEGLVIKLKKLPKINLRGYWSQALINSTIFATFRLLLLFCCVII